MVTTFFPGSPNEPITLLRTSVVDFAALYIGGANLNSDGKSLVTSKSSLGLPNISVPYLFL